MKFQSQSEEQLNALTHGIGAVLGIVALVLLIIFDTHKTAWSFFSIMVYGFSIIILLFIGLSD